MAEQIPAVTVKTDGRKRRWHQHKVERRNELVDGTIDAIRRLGRYLSMDEIAAEIGVSKTVLYRYFVDKNDLTTAVMMRIRADHADSQHGRGAVVRIWMAST